MQSFADPPYDRFMAKANQAIEQKWIRAKVEHALYVAIRKHLAETGETIQAFVGRAIEEWLKKEAA